MDLLALPAWATRLVEDKELGEEDLSAAFARAKEQGSSLADELLAERAVAEESIAVYQAIDVGVPYVDPRAYKIRRANASLVPEELARRQRLFPLFQVGGVITLGMVDPTNLAVIDQVRLRANCNVEPCICPPSALGALIERAYGATSQGDLISLNAPEQAVSTAVEDDEVDPRASNKIVALVRSILVDATHDGASDVHIEPEADRVRVRFRVDGILHEKSVHPVEQHHQIVSRIKVEAKMDIAETRRPQDGHYGTAVDGRSVDVRVSTIPTVHGENVVLRLLLSDGDTVDVDHLGMPDKVLAAFKHALDNPNGLILVTGPTGSGKTTTLYAALSRLNTIDRKVVTVEDPVEKRVRLMRQTQVNAKAGITFATGLRSILRQDPDVIMVGEIRDVETAEITVQAALTGHLVLSTLHTNTAAGALVRLSEMGVAPFLITSSLKAVIAQRLLRRVCDGCRERVEPDPILIQGLGVNWADEVEFFAGAGCGRCLRSGYKGRVGIYEMLDITAGLCQALLSGASRDEIEDEAHKALVTSIREDGLRQVRAGNTTLEEVARIVGAQRVDQGS